jgi:hypothetical protein
VAPVELDPRSAAVKAPVLRQRLERRVDTGERILTLQPDTTVASAGKDSTLETVILRAVALDEGIAGAILAGQWIPVPVRFAAAGRNRALEALKGPTRRHADVVGSSRFHRTENGDVAARDDVDASVRHGAHT